jgi:hypothetical protein
VKCASSETRFASKRYRVLDDKCTPFQWRHRRKGRRDALGDQSRLWLEEGDRLRMNGTARCLEERMKVWIHCTVPIFITQRTNTQSFNLLVSTSPTSYFLLNIVPLWVPWALQHKPYNRNPCMAAHRMKILLRSTVLGIDPPIFSSIFNFIYDADSFSSPSFKFSQR